MFDIQNRRYVGNKHKIMENIKQLMLLHCEGDSFFDVFAGTGAVTSSVICNYKQIYINDFLYSNNIIYKAFFLQEAYDYKKLQLYRKKYIEIDIKTLTDNYVYQNFGGKYFSNDDAKIIGDIRQDIEEKFVLGHINKKEYYILLASLLYSLDKIANTVGHYDAYRKVDTIEDRFKYELIKPIKLKKSQSVEIYKEDANILAKKIEADISFVDPPYNSRQYSRFYHVLENIAQWQKPILSGVAMKPKPENMSDYCKVSAVQAFRELIQDLKSKYIVVTYNNTHNPKSSSSKNKISKEQMEAILKSKGKLKVFEISHKCFNTGKTNFDDHKEYVYIVEVGGVHYEKNI